MSYLTRRLDFNYHTFMGRNVLAAGSVVKFSFTAYFCAYLSWAMQMRSPRPSIVQ